ncbi:MAG TPA: prolyl oligopeptidase family serine peptidase [Steroidobacteraceae bacterium]|jgi:predicted esterase
MSAVRNCWLILSGLLVFSISESYGAEQFTCASPSSDGSVRVEQLTLDGVPALVRVPPHVSKRTIVLWHGFGPPDSEGDLMKALPLDEVPAIKVYLGLPLFGARAPAAGEESVQQRQTEDYGTRVFEPVVLGAARELPGVVKALEERNCIRPGEAIGLFGFSAGGTAVLSALIEPTVPIRAAVTLNAPVGLIQAIDALERATAHPYAWSRRTRELAERSDAVHHAAQVAAGTPALMLIHGAKDTIVKPKGASLLSQRLQPLYHQAGQDARLKLLLEPGVSHDWTQPHALADLRAAVASWFNANL